MSNISKQIITLQDEAGMLRRALERIIQLYTDKSHFVYELLQNAEDAEAHNIRFVQYRDRLEVLHDGKPFTVENLQGLCDIGKSDKVDNLNQIGEFGVGFKSVFGICRTVQLYSEPRNFRNPEICKDADPFSVEIHDFTRPVDIPMEKLENAFTTRFVFPYSVGESFSGFDTEEKLIETISEKLQNLGITTLLFMKNLEQIEYQIRITGDIIKGEYLLEKDKISENCLLVSALGTSDNQQEAKDDVISYLKFSKKINNTQQTVDIAFPVCINEDGTYEFQKPRNPYVSVYFPTETESKLDFIVQGPYRTTPNRSSIPADDYDNKKLVAETATLLNESIIALKTAGKLNMSFLKVLPLSLDKFENFNLFEPLFQTVKNQFLHNAIIPSKEGEYVRVRDAKIARQEKLALLFSDSLLSELIGDGNGYHWLSTKLTETNREYERVYRFLTGELKIQVIRPEDLRAFFGNNPSFLPSRKIDWIVELYGILENVGNAFSKSKNETNMLTAAIVKTDSGNFVAPYKKTESKKYIPNVFLPSEKIRNGNIMFVDSELFSRCRHFFEDILQLQKPNEYEFFITDVKDRYTENYVFEEREHIYDIKMLLKYHKYEDHKEEVTDVIKRQLLVKCCDGVMRSAYRKHIYVPVNADGINIEAYFENLTRSISYVDISFYSENDISIDDLEKLGVKSSIIVGDNETQGIYDRGTRGRQPEWWTLGDFRWKFSIESIKDVLKYISTHPSAKDSIIKSQVIFRTLLLNENKLHGDVRISGSTQNLNDENCELVKILRGEVIPGWDGKWLLTESMEFVSQKIISKHDLNTSIYGQPQKESIIYDLLDFKKSAEDEIDEITKSLSKKQVDVFFENELRKRFGLTSVDLDEQFGKSTPVIIERESIYPFPIVRVKNWESIKKHAAEMLIYADPVRYDYAVRHIRISNHPKEAKAYLQSMYRHEGTYKYACQMCHEACSSIERAQIFNNPETELDPMNLCLCPTCATKYRKFRADEVMMKKFKTRILEISEADVQNGEQIMLPLGDEEIWFAQTHFVEIQELIKLTEKAKAPATQTDKKEENEINIALTENGDTSGLAVYDSYIGKHIYRSKDGMEGIITNIDEKNLYIKILNGKDEGKNTKLQLAFVLQHKDIYTIS